jgi:hypothetical protein
VSRSASGSASPQAAWRQGRSAQTNGRSTHSTATR